MNAAVSNKYKSAVDWWFYAAIGFAVLVLAFVSIQMILIDSLVGLSIVLITSFLALGLPVWILFSTYYVIDSKVLRVRSGPLSWDIACCDIQSVVPTRSPLSSPALSLNRLEIRYGENQSIMVSPVHPDQFIADLQLQPAD